MFDLRTGGGTADLRTYGVAFDAYSGASGTLNISGNTFNDLTYGLRVFDFANALTAQVDYAGLTGNTFTNTGESSGNIENFTGFVIETGDTISNGVSYDSFKVGTARAPNCSLAIPALIRSPAAAAMTKSSAAWAMIPPMSTYRPTAPTRPTSALATIP